MRQSIGILGLVFTLLAIGTLLAPARGDEPGKSGEDAKLEAFFKSYLDRWFADEPVSATLLGDHRFDAKLDDVSEEARARNRKRNEATLAQLPKAVAYDKLSRDAQIDFEILKHFLESEIWQTETFHPFADDPRAYGAYLTEGVYLLLTQSTLPKVTNIKNAASRIKEVPRIVATARKTIKGANKVKTETAINQTKGAIGFYKGELFEIAGVKPGEGELGPPAKAAASALEEHLHFLETEILPKANEEWRIGKEKFAKKLAYTLDAGFTTEEVLAEAEAEASRVEREMAVIARGMWSSAYPGKPVPPDDAPGRRQLVAMVLEKVAAKHGTPESLVSDARTTVAGIKDFIKSAKILTLPEPDRCAVIEMPEFMRGNSVAYLNPAPPLDAKARSEYAISPPPASWTPQRVESFLKEYNDAMLKILSIHEGYPGHYVQLEYGNRCPSLIRKVLSSGAFAEGWAVYTEQMMLDQGFGGGDPGLRLQQLKFYLRAVVNAILDQKMHMQNMSDSEALELLMGRAFQTEGEAVGKIIRSKQSSCQLSTYFVGRMAFYQLRQSLQRALGDRFDLAKFHEAALSHGTLPVKYLPELVSKDLGVPTPEKGVAISNQKPQ